MVNTAMHAIPWLWGSGAFITLFVLGIRALSLGDVNRNSEILPLPESIALVALWPLAFVVAVLIGVVGIAKNGVDRSLPNADSAKNLRHLSRKQAAALAFERQRLELIRATNDETERATRLILNPESVLALPAATSVHETQPYEWVRER